MEFLEKDLEQIIFEADKEKLNQKGLTIKGKIKRQLRIGNYGIADLVSFERSIDYDDNPFIRITIYELKKDKVGVGAFLQSISYAKGIKNYILKYKPKMCFTFDIVLVGREVDTSGSFCFIPDFIDGKDYSYDQGSISSFNLYSYTYGIDGLQFNNENGYTLTNQGF